MPELDFLTPDEIIEMEDISGKMLDEHVQEALREMMRREYGLLERFVQDQEMREISMWNIAALYAALERISQARTSTPGTGSSPDGPGDPPSPER